MIQTLPYRMFVLSRRADRPGESWTVEEVLEPGEYDMERKMADWLAMSLSRPWPLDWSICHEEWRVTGSVGARPLPSTTNITQVCRGPVILLPDGREGRPEWKVKL